MRTCHSPRENLFLSATLERDNADVSHTEVHLIAVLILDTHRHMEIYTQTDRQTDRQTDTETQTDTEVHLIAVLIIAASAVHSHTWMYINVM